jgi:sugar lactone lactonase YvrE
MSKEHSTTTSAFGGTEAIETAGQQDQPRGRGGIMFSIKCSRGWKVLLGAVASLALIATAVYAITLATTAARELGQPNFVSNTANTPDANSAYDPVGVAIDTSVTPNILYFADNGNNRVLAFTCPSTGCTALAEGAAANFVIGQPNFVTTSCNPTGVNATSLCHPNDIAVDSSGRLYVTDGSNNRVLVFARVTASGASAIAIFGQGGDFTSSYCNLNGGPDADSICDPAGVGVDKFGNVYIADYGNNRVLEYNTPFTVTSVPGSGDTTADLEFGQGSGTGDDFTTNSANSPSLSATSLYNPWDVTIDSNTNVYIADYSNNRVLEFNETATATSPPTNTTANLVFGQANFTSDACNTGGVTATSLCDPVSVAVDSHDNLYVADYSNSRELEYNSPVGTSNTTADLVFGQDDDFTSNSCDLGGKTGNAGASAQTLCNPYGSALDSSNNLYVGDLGNNRVLAYTETANPPSNNTATTELGQADLFHTAANIVNSSSLYQPEYVAIDSLNHLYVADTLNNRVLGFTDASAFVNGAAATIVIGQPDFDSGSANQSGYPDATTLYEPLGVAVDSSNNLYVSDYYNNRVLEYNTPFSQSVTTDLPANAVWGQGGDFTSNGCNLDGSPGAETLCNPVGLTIDHSGNLWVADYSNNRVLEYYSPLFNATANFVLGQPDFVHNSANLGGAPTASSLYDPASVRPDSHSNIYVADDGNNRVLEYNNPLAHPTTLDPAANEVWGQGGVFTSGGGNTGGLSANSLYSPTDIALDTSNNLYIADYNNSRALEFTESANPPTNTTANRVFGQADDFTTNLCNFGGNLPSAASACGIAGVAVDPTGNLYVADLRNNRVLQYDPPDFSPGLVAFENVPVNGRTTRTTYLVNTQGVWLSNIKISISGDKEFTISSNSCSSNLGPKEKCAVKIAFARSSAGVKRATLSATDDATNSPQHASLYAN